jgi:hypothetical protein
MKIEFITANGQDNGELTEVRGLYVEKEKVINNWYIKV